ncbi:MAG TPA: threonine--tRNA ligase [Candidatus Babeliales bacterium]|nr:threonine--tRNA ligase [Candidatus Babeliales bacterium]
MKPEQDINVLRHSAAHLLAHAVTELYPDTQLTIGPATPEGFFYDFLPTSNFKESDLPAIAQRMEEIADRKLPLTHEQVSKKVARELYKNNPFKLELIDQIEGDTVGIARQGDFYDLCRGGHVANTSLLKNFKLLTVSGSYWRGNREGKALQRISGTAFFTPKELRMYEKQREEALKYDHRKLGKELDLFSFHDEGPGFPFFHPQGKIVYDQLVGYLKKLLKAADYQEIATPMMLSDELWKRSGHYDHYKNNMYFSEIDERSFAIKPMNCPGAILIYKERPRSYRELPLKLAEFGLAHRYELSGVLHGLFRARAFTIDDAHVFCTPHQLEEQIKQMVDITYTVLKKFGFDTITVGISTKPENAMGDDVLWQKATDALKHALESAGVSYEIYEGEGAFYGPKIEFRIQDSMGREWQCGTIQVDFFQPQNFDLTYVSPEGTRARPVMVHRAIYGSIERFFGILVEHFKGRLPFFIAPVQMKILTITDEQKEYGHELLATLKERGYRVAMDESSDPISGKIKTAQLQQIPWMLVIGAKELENKTITLRHRDGKQEFGLTLDEILKKAEFDQK